MNAFHNAAKSYKKSNPEGMFFVFLRCSVGLMYPYSRCDGIAPSDQALD